MTATESARDTRHAPAQPGATASLGRFQLLRLVGKSTRTLIWLAIDPNADEERFLVMPRVQSASRAELERQLQSARKAMRVTHPGLATAVEVGEHDRWLYVVYDCANAATLTERIAPQGMPPVEVAQLSVQILDGLAFAHEAGLAHRDVQAGMVVVDERGGARLMGLEVASASLAHAATSTEPVQDATALQTQRQDAQRDVLAFGLVVHFALTGQHPLEQSDTARVIAAMPPIGREIVRLPWTTPRPIPEPLRVIANRATDRQERQRYLSARTLARALEGWIKADAETDGGPLALLLDRVRSVGPLPSLPGASRRVARLAMMERERTIELAEMVLQDPALVFELLRQVNSAQVRGSMVSGSGPVLTMRRAIAMLGLDGVRRAALSLRDWPGPLGAGAAEALNQTIARSQQAARIAQVLRPAGYDLEVVYLIALLQNLGRLVTRYHFSEEAMQMDRLMQPVPEEQGGIADEPGMSEEAAGFAVLGVDIDAVGSAVARNWGLDDSVLHMIHRFALGTPIRAIETDDDMLRATASCANEVLDAFKLPAPQQQAELKHVAQRYARALKITLADLQTAAEGQSLQSATPPAAAGARHAA